MPAAKVMPVENMPVEDLDENADVISFDKNATDLVEQTPLQEEKPADPTVLAGFGADLPLIIALQQVVPAGFQYAFANGVDPGVIVSWEGGKNWRDVLADALRPVRLEYRLQNHIVAIGPLREQQPQFQQPSEAAPAMSTVVVTPGKIRSEQIPDDLLITSKPSITTMAPPVSIRRQKPSGLARVENESAVKEPQASQALVVAESNSRPSFVEGDMWQAKNGDTLRDTLKKWSAAAQVDMFWSSDYDYRINQDVSYAGGFDEAVKNLLDQFAGAKPQPYGQMHREGENPKVLIIRSYDQAG
jgi:hypothetical protein